MFKCGVSGILGGQIHLPPIHLSMRHLHLTMMHQYCNNYYKLIPLYTFKVSITLTIATFMNWLPRSTDMTAKPSTKEH